MEMIWDTLHKYVVKPLLVLILAIGGMCVAAGLIVITFLLIVTVHAEFIW